MKKLIAKLLNRYRPSAVVVPVEPVEYEFSITTDLGRLLLQRVFVQVGPDTVFGEEVVVAAFWDVMGRTNREMIARYGDVATGDIEVLARVVVEDARQRVLAKEDDVKSSYANLN